MGFLKYLNSDEAKEAVERQENSLIETYIMNTNHKLYSSDYEYILIDNATGKKYTFDKVLMDYPNDIFKQISKNREEQKTKEIDLEWLHEPDYHKRRKLLSKKYIKENKKGELLNHDRRRNQ